MVWLQASGCWARIPDSKTPCCREDYPREPKRARLSSFEQGETEFVGSKEVQERCPICLDTLGLREKAVATPCMHHYHFRCIGRWIAGGKQDCPMCRCSMLSILHDIQDEKTFREEKLRPPSDPNNKSFLLHLSEVLGVEDLIQSRSSSLQIRIESGTQVDIPSANRRSITRRFTSRPHNQERRSTRQGVRSSLVGSRPYSLRIQRYVYATWDHHSTVLNQSEREEAANTQGSNLSADVEHGTDNEVLQWRRHIYEQNLWAVPLPSAFGAERMLRHWGRRQRRLAEWIDRELMAILQTRDTAIVRSFVLGVLQAHGGAEALSAREPVVLLEPFLSEHSAHFWHELNCFAFAPAYTIETYDRLVDYRQRGAASDNHADMESHRFQSQNVQQSSVRRGYSNSSREHLNRGATRSGNVRDRWRLWQPGDPL